MPKVSIVLPNYNTEPEYISASLSSLRKQTFTDFECLIIDESNISESSERCKLFCGLDSRFKYVRPTTKRGLAASLNLGVSLAQGEYIARFDADDICSFDRIEKQLSYLNARSNIDVLGSWMTIVNKSGTKVGIRRYKENHDDIVKDFVFRNAMGHPSVMFRKSLTESLDCVYSQDYKFSEDLELWLRLISKGAIFSNLQECLITYRQPYWYRKSDNWIFNAKARIKHLSPPQVVLKTVIIGCTFGWSFLPRTIQQSLYKKANFSINNETKI